MCVCVRVLHKLLLLIYMLCADGVSLEPRLRDVVGVVVALVVPSQKNESSCAVWERV